MKTKSLKKLFVAIPFISIALLLFSCGNTGSSFQESLKDVASMQSVNGNSLIVADLLKFKDTVDIPLSSLVEELQIVKLDNKEEALVGGWVRTLISDNYILISNNKHVPYKLFDKKGKFLCTIGSYGQGPEEYMMTYDEQIDEKHRRIYILPWNADRILVYDLQGNPLDFIPLAYRIPKGQFKVNTEKKELIITKLPFPNSEYLVWKQDFDGNVIAGVAPGSLTLPQDFSNEVSAQKNIDAYDIMLFAIAPPRVDTLYHYNEEQNKILPKFTLNYPGEDVPWHGYFELPQHFAGVILSPVQVGPGSFVGSNPVYFIVDKKSLRGNFFKLYNDYLGNLDADIWSMKNGYYMINTEPLDLKDRLSGVLENGKVSIDKEEYITQVISDLNENDNNIIMYGKLKK